MAYRIGAYEEITINGVTTLTADNIVPVTPSAFVNSIDTKAMIALISGVANFLCTGDDPSALIGMPVPAYFELSGRETLENTKFCDVGGPAVIRVQYEYTV